MTKIATDPRRDVILTGIGGQGVQLDDDAAARGVTRVELDELLERADFVHLNCPLTSETEGLMGREVRPHETHRLLHHHGARAGAGRSGVVRRARERGIAGAGVDVFQEEPPDPTHPLLSLDTVVASPHTAGITLEATRNIAVATAEQWITIFAGKVPPRVINPEAWPTYADRFEARLGVRPDELPT